MTFVQMQAKTQLWASDCLQLNVKKTVWWDPPPSLSALCNNNSLSPGDLKGSWDIWMTRKENTLGLDKAPQSCSDWPDGPYSMMFGAARDLQRCVAKLMWFVEEDFLDILLLEPTGDLPLVFPAPEEEAASQGESHEAQVTATHPPRHEEQASKPKSTAGLGEATKPQVACECSLPPAFKSPPSDQEIFI